MKILMINSTCGVGSTGRICTDIADTLSARGHEVKIAYGRDTVPEKYQKYAVKIGSNISTIFHGLQTRLFDNVGFSSRQVTVRFVEWVKKFDPDIIHLHNLHGYYINVEVLFSYLKTCGKRIIWTLHDCWCFTGHCVYFDYASCELWKTGCRHCTQNKEYPKSYSDGSRRNWQKKQTLFTLIPNLTIVTPSNWLSELVKQSYMKDYTVNVINNGIDTNTFKPSLSNIKEQYHIGRSKVVLGVAATWNRRKGLEYIAEIASKINDDYRVVVIGATEQQKGTLPENVVVVPRTNSVVELAEWYTAADVFINPTLEDNYPTTNLEAIACGTPVVTFDTGGSPESAAYFGKTVSKCGVDEMLKAIYEVNKMCVMQNFDRSLLSRERMVEEYIKCYLG